MFTFLIHIQQLLTFWIVFPFLFLLGIYLSFKLRFLQVRGLGTSFQLLVKNQKQEEGDISHYEAISAVLAGNFGTGNISGMAVALSTGGPGALVWMWVMAFFGSMIQYASCFLGALYRTKNPDAQFSGGPMYYLEKGLNWKRCARIFAFVTLLAAFTVGNFTQVNSVTLPLKETGYSPFYLSLILAVCTAVVVLGGMQRFANVAAAIVPVMALLYLGAAGWILFLHMYDILPQLKLMLISSVSPQPLAGGLLGFGFARALSVGFGRGIFATDAGTGMAPIIQSSARTAHPVGNGLVALLPPFLVMVVCTMTGLVLLVTGAWQIEGLVSTNMCIYAFEKDLGSFLGSGIVTVSLLLFAYTTIIAWASCADKAAEYLWGKKSIPVIRWVYILLVPVGALISVEFVWVLADLCVAVMMIVNLAGIAALSKQVIENTRLYFLESNSAPLEASL